MKNSLRFNADLISQHTELSGYTIDKKIKTYFVSSYSQALDTEKKLQKITGTCFAQKVVKMFVVSTENSRLARLFKYICHAWYFFWLDEFM